MSDREIIDADRRDRHALEAALQTLGCRIQGSAACCPEHDDKNPSASIGEHNGAWKVYCHRCEKGWDVWDLRAKAEGRDVGEVLRANRATATPAPRSASQAPAARPAQDKQVFPTIDAMRQAMGPALEHLYPYHHPGSATPDMIVLRLRQSGGRKTFMQGSPVPGGYSLVAPPKPWPLYRLPEIVGRETIIVVEGEKCVHALAGIGMAATTSPGGAGKAAHADWSPLAGRQVFLWPDNDPADPKTGKRTGIDHMRDVARMLDTVEPAPSVHWIDPDQLGLPAKGDVADLLDALDSKTPEQCRAVVEEILRDATSLGASDGVRSLIEDTIAGKRTAIAWPWPRISSLSKALLPGTVTLLFGAGGATKSWWLLQALAHWYEERTRCSVFELEDDRPYHLYRALAQRTGNSLLFDDAWVKEHAVDARAAELEHREFLNGFGRCIYESPDVQQSRADLSKWLTDRAKAGHRVLAIDPITAAKDEDKAWACDLMFVMEAKKIMRDYGASLILVAHPRKAQPGARGKVGMDDMAGGAAYQRFAHNVLHMEAVDPSVPTLVRSAGKLLNLPVNRAVTIQKARNGRGAGVRVGFIFDPRTLRSREVGIIQPKGLPPPGGTDDDEQPVRPPNPRMYQDPQESEDVTGP